MIGEVERSIRSRRDLLSVYVNLGQFSLKAADRFLIAVEKTFRQIASMPGMGEPYESGDPDFGPIRRCLVTGFRNYLDYYAPIEGGIRVLRVVHAAREPEDLIDPGDLE